MTRISKRPGSCLAVGLLAALLVGGCGVVRTPEDGALGSPTSGSATAAPTEQQPADGPHAAPDRALASRAVTDSADGRSSIIELDFGNVTAGGYAAPSRGQIITPKAATAATPPGRGLAPSRPELRRRNPGPPLPGGHGGEPLRPRHELPG